MESRELLLRTGTEHLVDLTSEVQSYCRGFRDGLCSIFVPHATAGLVLMEMGAGSERDLEELAKRIFPRDQHYEHRHGSMGHGADHLVPALFSPSLVLPVIGGSPALGTWQHVVLADFNHDNPNRRVRLSFLPG